MSQTKLINTIVVGETLLYRIRKIRKNIAKPELGFKPSIELVELVPNDTKDRNALAEMNDDDDRYNSDKPQHAFSPVSLERAISLGWITQEAFDKLQHCKDVEGENQKEGEHFLTVNILNPINNDTRLRVKVTETFNSSRSDAKKYWKKNKYGKFITSGGKKYYRFVDIAVEGFHKSQFIAQDKDESTIMMGDILEIDQDDSTKASDNAPNLND